jgi:MinD superfamily P-loop ATPase
LRLAVDVARALNRPCGVVVNRAQPGATETRHWCREAGVPILAEIPDSQEIARAYSRGELAAESVPGLREIFDRLFFQLQEERPQAEACFKPTASDSGARFHPSDLPESRTEKAISAT